MANCVKCGRRLPSFSFGKLRNLCQWCREYEVAHAGGNQDDDAVQPVMTKPWERRFGGAVITPAIFAINAAVFLGMTLAGVSLTSPTGADLIRFGADYGPRTLSGEWWRLLTSTFVHIGIIHIALNMWCLWNLGELAERLYGRLTFATVYLMTGIAGSLASIAWHPATVSAGASGAIFGIAGALIASLKLGSFSLPSGVIQPVYRSVLAFAGYNLVFGFMIGRIDNAAHIGGLVAGLLLGALLARVAPDPSATGRRTAIFVMVGLLMFGGANLIVRSRAYRVHTTRAQQLLAHRDVDGAIGELKIAIQQKPTYAYAHLMLGEAYLQKTRWDDAEKELKAAVQLDPNDRTYRDALGLLYLATNRAGEAMAQFSAITARNPSDGPAHVQLGIALAAQGRHQEALAEYKKAVALGGDMAAAYSGMGRSYAELKQNDEAIAAFKKAVELDPEDYDTQLVLAKAYEANGLTQEAQAAYRKAKGLQEKEESEQKGAIR